MKQNNDVATGQAIYLDTNFEQHYFFKFATQVQSEYPAKALILQIYVPNTLH